MRFLLVAGALACAACGVTTTSYGLASTPQALGAYANVDATFDENQQVTRLRVDTLALVRPSRIANEARYFVVWGRANGGSPWVRAGTLDYDPWASGGTFHGAFPGTEFDLQVTAEKDFAAAAPSAEILFAQHIGPPLKMDGSQPDES